MCTPFPHLTMSWINEVEMGRSIDDLLTSRLIEGRRDFPDFEMLDARVGDSGGSLQRPCLVEQPAPRERTQIPVASNFV